ncbi:MAG: hypothetical protein BWX80_02140 [Candidatus Hydrogenedentes bacterium ADurb.Bin101]|nr:hypothetical protein [Candidatus Hydrogenedentota bacterium]OQC05284.1 MAG: hypothetical protein BWX80_02140 [Candidatus Hydrogenedentes bacterium ADurb.Bin101]HOC67599.1 hypothetical protein [Candidatus Hydrogenedentota bacterium]HOH31511.1 hypothetical protein [Candidatus Hydrogenedentota bacterium]
MTMLAACIVLAVAGQGWEKPVIQEAELAAPVAIEPAAPPATLPEPPGEAGTAPQARSGMPSESGTNDGAVNELRWEYDESGQPVVRQSPVDLSEAETPAQVPQPSVQPKAQAFQEIKKKPPRARSVATFWFVLPKK